MNKKNGGTISLTQKKSYSRYFIILQEDEKGYSQTQDKLCSGYAKLEMKNDKCKISYYVQNLKKEPVPYYMVLICSKKDIKKLVKIGEMNIDENGHTEVAFEYPVDNIAESGISMDKVSGAAIVKFINTEVVSVMSGFATTDIPDWKGYPLVEALKRSEEDKSLEKSIFDKYEEKVIETKTVETSLKPETTRTEDSKDDNKQVESKEKLPVEVILVEENEKQRSDDANGKVEEVEKQRSNDVNEKVEEVQAEIIENSEKVEEDNDEESELRKSSHKHGKKEKEYEEKEYKEKIEVKVEAKVEKVEGKVEKKVEEHKEYKEHKEDYPKGAVGDFFKMMVEGFEEMLDMCDDIKRCRWFRVPVNSIYDMTNVGDYNKYTVIYYPMVNYFSYIKKYGHFLIGHKCDNSGKMKYLVYAIPGIKSKMEQPFEGKSGFVTWIPLRDGEDNEDSFGYWLMFYDFRTSTIIIPVK
jgi:hypothetical protein